MGRLADLSYPFHNRHYLELETILFGEDNIRLNVNTLKMFPFALAPLAFFSQAAFAIL